MNYKVISIALKACAVAFALSVLLFADGDWGISTGFIGSILKEITEFFHDPVTQKITFLCFGIYFVGFIVLRCGMDVGFWRIGNPVFGLICGILICVFLYATDYVSSIQALMLLGGAALGQGAAIWAALEVKKSKLDSIGGVGLLVAVVLLLLLTLASVANVKSEHVYQYRNHLRWSGPWDNPNVYGLLMGVGGVLVFGLLVQSVSFRLLRHSIVGRGSRGAEWLRGLKLILCLIAAGMIARGLMHSYCRGAWLGTICGLFYLGLRMVRRQKNSGALECLINAPFFSRRGGESLMLFSRVRTNVFFAIVIVISMFVCGFWHFRQMDWHPGHRVFSIGDQNDFSWRNRVAAWKGALQIAAEHPWFGAGWNQPEPLYEQFYLAPRLNGSGGSTIELNDYFMLGATLGLPALICFGAYIWLSLTKKRQEGQGRQLEMSEPICRAGAIVLLVGFWFDGGLFKLATAAPFWILLELGRMDGHKEAQKFTK